VWFVRIAKKENATMKAFIIAMLAAGATLLLAALFWPDRLQPASQRQRNLAPVAASVDTKEMEPVHERRDLLPTPPQPATPAMPTAAIAVFHSTDDARSSAATSNKPALEPITNQSANAHLTDEQRTLTQTGTDNTSLRNIDFPRTYISKIHVDLTSPNHWVSLTWSGPNARLQVTTQYHSSPGRGLGYNNCDDVAESNRTDSNCTPKGTMHVEAFSNSMVGSPECRYVTWFDTKRGIALHYYPFVPNYPASHGCVRLDEYAAQLIHNNSKIGETEVIIDGKWTFAR
jgi:lipoprotein-anchoring transpeptidase ErfK/SrfK